MGGERYIYTNTIRCAVQGGMGSRQVADFFWVCALGYLGRADRRGCEAERATD